MLLKVFIINKYGKLCLERAPLRVECIEVLIAVTGKGIHLINAN
jgi:hypothetical protein